MTPEEFAVEISPILKRMRKTQGFIFVLFDPLPNEGWDYSVLSNVKESEQIEKLLRAILDESYQCGPDRKIKLFPDHGKEYTTD